MRELLYTNYESGNSGLSNGIMSIECGVVMAFLTNRFLRLDGNVSPPANIVDYNGRVDNSTPSKVTDLIDIPVPWADITTEEAAALTGVELTDRSLMDSVFFVPGTVDITSDDARDFARGRNNWICETDELVNVPLLRVSETPLIPNTEHHRNNLSFYSYLFYLDGDTRKDVYQLLSRMQAKQPYLDLAQKIATDLGTYNAVHMRRGDFKLTYGVTVLDRHPWEAIDIMGEHFSFDETLLICTDERDDPFFDEIKTTWADHIFIDHHILDNYSAEFSQLPQQDSLALAFLSQLVAAESADFIGTMTSTYSSMIQRLRGNRGKHEPFKFLWNELPEPGETSLERGRHPVSDCVPLENGIMVKEFDGAYTWNHYTPLINPAWMREWPESFLIEQPTNLITTTVAAATSTLYPAQTTEDVYLSFEGLRVKITCSVPGLAASLRRIFYDSHERKAGNVIAQIAIEQSGAIYRLSSGSEVFASTRTEESITPEIVNRLVPILHRAMPKHCWFKGMVFKRGDETILYLGDEGDGHRTIAEAMSSTGWHYFGDCAIPVRQKDAMALPLASTAGAVSFNTDPQVPSPVKAIVTGHRQLHNRSELSALSPSAAVAQMTMNSIDFHFNRATALEALCKLAESVKAYRLSFSRVDRVPELLQQLEQPPATREAG